MAPEQNTILWDEAVRQLLNGAGNTHLFELVAKWLVEQGWVVYPVTVSNKIIGAIIQKGSELHTSISPEYQKKWNPRPYILNILYPALLKYGSINSEAMISDVRAIRWLKKLGFERTSEDDNKIYFTLTNLNSRIRFRSGVGALGK